MSFSIPSPLQSFYSEAKEKVVCGCAMMQESAKIVGESVSYIAFQVIHMVAPSMSQGIELIYVRVCNVWERIKAHFEKKGLQKEIKELSIVNSSLQKENQTLRDQLDELGQKYVSLSAQVDELKNNYRLVQTERDLLQNLSKSEGKPLVLSDSYEGVPDLGRLEKEALQFLSRTQEIEKV